VSALLKIVSVYPELLGTYGDGGNVVVLERRLAWRGVAVEVVTTRVRDPLPADGDLYVLGGSEDVHQLTALEALRRGPLLAAVERGAHVLGVCAGLQLLGTAMDTADRRYEGLGLIDLTTAPLEVRVVGEVVAEPTEVLAGLPAVTGFANHRGGTRLGPGVRALGRTVSGRGNDGEQSAPEGAVQGRVVTTYLHGPVLARNPALADWLLARVVGEELPPLATDPAVALHDERVRAAR
jgi:CobQ-like glutamine amidotransferase family enzyme